MNPLLLGGLVGVGGGLLKGVFDSGRADRQRKVQAETTRWSPWTGMQAQAPQEPDYLGSALQFGTTGAMLGQGFQNQATQNDFNSKYLGILGQNGGVPLSQQIGNYQIPNLATSTYSQWRY